MSDRGNTTYTFGGDVVVTYTTLDPIYTAPTAKENLEYTGEAQELLNAGSTEYGTIEYSLDGNTWSTNIPTGTEAQEYTVYWKLIGDAEHGGIASTSITVEIVLPTPTPISVEGYIQVFKDAACTEYATGELDKVYVRVNKNYGFGDATTYEASGGIIFRAHTPTSEYPQDTYYLEYRIDVDNYASSQDFTTPFESGDVKEVNVLESETGDVIDFTNLPHIFGA